MGNVMLNNNVKVKDTKNQQKLAYHKPKVYHLGAMDKIQGGPIGSYRESNGYYYG